MTARSTIRVALALVFAATLACGTEPERKPTPTPEIPQNTTPEGTIERLIWAYENKKCTEYANLFTEDFTFEFSAAADPDLAQQYANGWFKTDEDTSACHLFGGFLDPVWGYLPAASSIDLTFAKTAPTGDTEGRDPDKFKVLATRVDGEVVVPPTGSETEDTRYIISNNFHRFFLVRGDAALDTNNQPTVLAPLPADSLHWYIYRWIDETAQLGAPARIGLASMARTWARVKATYR